MTPDRGGSVDPGPRAGDVAPGRAAVIAGSALLMMTVVAGASFAAYQALVTPGDAALTARDIGVHEQQFRWVVAGFLTVAVLDVVVAWALAIVLSRVNRGLATVSAWLRVMYASVFASVTTNLLVALRMVGGDAGTGSLGAGSHAAAVLSAVNAFKDGWDASLAVFGLHLAVVGYLVLRSSFAPRTLGVLVALAGLGYTVDGVGRVLLKGYDANVTRYTFIGEVLLMVWLLWKGRGLRDAPAAPPGDALPSDATPGDALSG